MARFRTSGGNRLDFPVMNSLSVCLSANVLITGSIVIRHVTRFNRRRVHDVDSGGKWEPDQCAAPAPAAVFEYLDPQSLFHRFQQQPQRRR